MRILIAHNRYQEPGGEDRVVSEEAAMLERHGHTVDLFTVTNDDIQSPLQKLRAAAGSFYSLQTANNLRHQIASFNPDVLHVHNFLPTLSPSAFFAAADKQLPVVQTLHNYRLICANAKLFRDNQPCEQCLTAKSALPGIRHACYRDSRAASAIVGGTVALHDLAGTWQSRIHRYIALTQFAADMLSQWRVPADRIRVKPNFIADPETGNPPCIDAGARKFALFAGRLSAEKGLQTLIDADALNQLNLDIHIAGDGPMMPALRAAAARPSSRLRILGALPSDHLQDLMRRAAVLVVPSIWYEPFGMVVVQAFAAGLPVVCSNIGGLPELVTDRVTGLTFQPANPAALCQAVNQFATPTDANSAMRIAARQRYETHYSESRNHDLLTGIYREAIAARALQYATKTVTISTPGTKSGGHMFSTPPRISVAALLTCFNRREHTLASLDRLFSQTQLDSVALTVFLVDDGSTDGTAQRVKELYPQVRILTGNGQLYWNGGMRLAFAEARAIGFDYYLWLNDDTFIVPTALHSLLDCARFVERTDGPAIVTGSTADPVTGNRSYGGFRIDVSWRGRRLTPVTPLKAAPQKCDTMNGNFTLIPRIIADALDNLEESFHHSLGDLDYGFRARKRGFGIYVAPGFIGTCRDNPVSGTWRDTTLPFRARWRHLNSPKGSPFATWALYCRRHLGLWWPLYLVSPYIKTILTSINPPRTASHHR